MDQRRAGLGLPDPRLPRRTADRPGLRPAPATLRRLLVQPDGDALDTAIGAFLTARAAPSGPALRAIAVDGKALRGSRTATTTYVTLLAAMDHTGTVLAQRQVADKSNGIPAFAPLLDSIDLTGTVITAVAARRAAARRDRRPYDPDTDAVVQEELAEDRRREEAEQQRRQEQQRIADRAEELARLGAAGRLNRSVPSQAGDEAARDLLDENRDYRAAKVDAWLARARALADQSGHYADPAARAVAVGLLPVPVRARAALLAALAHTGAPVDGDLEFVGRLAQADPDALAAWLGNAAAVKGGTA